MTQDFGRAPPLPVRLAEPSAATRRTEVFPQTSATSASRTRHQVMVDLGKGDEVDKRLQPFMSNFGGHSEHNHAPGESCEAGPFINPGSGWPRVAAPAPAPVPGGVQVRDGRVGTWSAQSVERALAAEGGSLAAPPSPLAQRLAAGGPPSVDVRQDMALTPANEGHWKRDIAGPHDPEQNPADRWKLKPDSIVLHYTAGANFPENLTDSLKYDGHEKQVADMRAAQERKNAVLAAEGKPTVDVDKYLKENHPGQFGGEAPGVSEHSLCRGTQPQGGRGRHARAAAPARRRAGPGTWASTTAR